jgi:hypothetical protein
VSWDNVLPQATVLLYSLGIGDGAAMQQYVRYLDKVLGSWMAAGVKCPGPDFVPCVRPGGQVYYRYSAS